MHIENAIARYNLGKQDVISLNNILTKSNAIRLVIESLCQIKRLDSNLLADFSMQINHISDNEKACVSYVIACISIEIYQENYQSQIEELIKKIEKALDENGCLSFPCKSGINKFIGLFNIYCIIGMCDKHIRDCRGSNFYLCSDKKQILKRDIPFAINALILSNQLSQKDSYCNLSFSQPLYPKDFFISSTNKIALKRGIKNSDFYFPYKSVFKIAKGDSEDNTFLATNAKKNIYIRAIANYLPDSVFASKIATFVSKKHFSSERLFSNCLIGSKKIAQYHISVADHTTRKAREQYIEIEKVFPGTGIIDEVLNFTCESDFNIENFGFSDHNVDQSYLCKIDFDHCSFWKKIDNQNYEKDILSKPLWGIYRGLKYVQENKEYIKEKLEIRLKLSILSRELITALSEKAYINQEKQEKAIKETISRTNIALDMFIKHDSAKEFLKSNLNLLNQFLEESIQYINRHFDQEQCLAIIESVQNSIENINVEIAKKLKIKMNSLINIQAKDKKIDCSEVPLQESKKNECITKCVDSKYIHDLFSTMHYRLKSIIAQTRSADSRSSSIPIQSIAADNSVSTSLDTVSNVMSSQSAVSKSEHQNNKLNDELFNAIQNKLKKYIVNRSSCFLNLFRNKELTQLKRLIAQAALDILKNESHSIMTAQYVEHMSSAILLLNTCVEELVLSKKYIGIDEKATKCLLLETIKNGLECDRVNLEHLNQMIDGLILDKASSALMNAFSSALKIVQNERKQKLESQWGKKYRFGFSSGLGRIAIDMRNCSSLQRR